MKEREKLTVIIPCKNEEKNIRQCIGSVGQLADEVLVADSGSTDRTIEIARELGAKIIEREYKFSGDFKNWAIPQAMHDWVLIIDADERLSKELIIEIDEILNAPTADGYWIHRKNYFLGRLVRYSGWQNDRVLRLFKRDMGRYIGDTDHAEVEISTGRVKKTKNKIIHFSYWNYDQCILKLQRYSAFQAKRWDEQGKKADALNLLFRGPLRFLQTFILRLGFLDGLVGIQVCTLIALQSYMKQARLWELQKARAQQQLDPTD